MNQRIKGTVLSATKQWWLKINTKPIRTHALDGAIFPYIIKVQYTVGEKTYTRLKWLSAGQPVPSVGSTVDIVFSDNKPSKAKILL